MNNKRNTYILILALLFIWGVIGYKFIANLDSEEETITTSINKPENIIANKMDTFTIIANYTDPFKVSAVKPISNAQTNNKFVPKIPQTNTKPPIKKEEKISINVSHIKYFGIVSNSKTGKKVGILSINKQETLVSNGTEIEFGKVISVSDDKVKISYKENIFEIERTLE